MTALPAQLGYRMPAEWEPHEATWIAWPHNHDDWPGKFTPIPWVYTEIVRYLHFSERVRILIANQREEARARKMLERIGVDLVQVDFFRLATDRVWTRDYGPTFLKSSDGHTALLDWHFNAWAKYPNWKHDDAIPHQLGRLLKLETWQPTCNGQRVVLEGGSIDVNGEGLLLTTEECLLSDVQQRNPGMSRQDYEQVFSDYLGVKKVLWLHRGIVGDDTHGHVDDLARFVSPRTIVTVMEDNPADDNHVPLTENLELLRGMTDPEGRQFDVVTLPMPGPVLLDGQRLPASYANFYIANDLVLVPTFNDANDRQALGLLAELFPGRKVIGIHAVDLVWGLGTLHCLTQQQPRGGSVGG